MLRARPVIVGLALVLSWAGGRAAHAAGDTAAALPAAPDPAFGMPAPGPRAAPPPAPETRLTSWYGYQIIIADAASLGLGLLADSPHVLAAGYLAGPIIIHALHGRPGLAVGSPMLRVFLPLLGVAIGTSAYRTCNANYDECNMGGLIWGGGIGLATAVILDWSLGWEKEVVPPPETKRTGFALTAFGLAPSAGGVNLVLGGRF